MSLKIIKLSALATSIALIASLLSSSTAFATPPEVELPNDTDCTPAVLMLRGSDEKVLTDDITHLPGQNYLNLAETKTRIRTNGAEGPVISRLLTSFAKSTNPDETVSKVRFIGIDYTAAPVFPDMQNLMDAAEHFLVNYHISYLGGARDIINFIRGDIARGCDTKYTLVGYSQGVLSVRIALVLLGSDVDRIASTYVFGDPYQKANGAGPGNRITVANNSAYTAGMLRVLRFALSSLQYRPQAEPGVSALEALFSQLDLSDALIYRTGNNPSRVVCHLKDPTCSIPFFGIEHHLNYFDKDEEPGDIDLTAEIPEFDLQVKKLAESTPPSTPNHALARSVSFENKNTFYNVAGYKPGEKCWWDEDSDWEWEVEEGPCFYTTLDTAPGYRQLTVKVVDNYGGEEYFTDMTYVHSEESLINLTAMRVLDPNSWYQYHPYEATQSCLTFKNNLYQNIQKNQYSSLTSEDCSSSAPLGFEETATTALQSFKLGETAGTGLLSGPKLVWGYDDNYAMSHVKYSPNSSGVTELGKHYGASSFVTTPEYVKTENGINYYRLRTAEYGYVTVQPDGTTKVTGCSLTICENQLFSATKVSADLGNLSIERDTTPPLKITGLTIDSLTATSVTLSWDAKTDIRAGFNDADLYYKMSGDYQGDWFDTTITIPLPGSAPDHAETFTFNIQTVDAAQNVSEVETITLTTPLTSTGKPSAPVLSYSNDYVVTIGLPYDATVHPGEEIIIYRNDEIYDYISAQNSYTDYYTAPGNTYTYSYVVRDYGVSISEQSNPLTVVR